MTNTNINIISTEKVSRPCSQEAFFIVKDGETIIGFISKFRDTRTTKNPWKAFGQASGVVDPASFKCFYPQDGGKAAAIAQVRAFNGAV